MSTIQLIPEQQRVLDEADLVRAVDPRTNASYVLVPEEVAAASDLAGGTVPAHDTDRIRPGEDRVDGGPTRRVGRVGGEIRARVDELRGVGGPIA